MTKNEIDDDEVVTQDGLRGLYFLTFNEKGELQYQGMIGDYIGARHVLVTLFDALTGYPSSKRLFDYDQVVTWRLHADREAFVVDHEKRM